MGPLCSRVAQVARAALTERTGSSTKGRTPNIRYFVAKPSIVAIYALFEWLSQSFEQKPSCFRRAFNESHPAFVELSSKAILFLSIIQQKSSCFRRAFNESHPAFVELSTKVILLSKSSWRDCFRRTCFLTIFYATDTVTACFPHDYYWYG